MMVRTFVGNEDYHFFATVLVIEPAFPTYECNQYTLFSRNISIVVMSRKLLSDIMNVSVEELVPFERLLNLKRLIE